MASSVDQGINFENWICDTLSWQLNLSKSKEVGIQIQFSPFADYVRPLAEKAPEEFERFFKALKEGVEGVSKWHAPRGYVVIPQSYKGEWLTYPNGKFRHRLARR